MKALIYLNGKEHKRDIPTAWEHITFGQFLELDKFKDDIIKVIAFLTRIDYEQLRKAKIKNLEEIVFRLGFLNKRHELLHPDEKNPLTREILFKYIPREICSYPVPKDLEFEQVQMYIDLKNYLAESSKMTPMEKLERYTLYCAVYACKAKHGRYDWQLAEAMKDEFLQAPCTEVMGIGNFTLVKLIGLNLGISPDSQKAGSRLRRFRLALKGYLVLMGRHLPSLTSKKKLV